MKKILLSFGFLFATIAPSFSAPNRINVPKGDEPTYVTEGSSEFYIMSYTDNNGFGALNYTNGKVEVRKSSDGKTWYFNGLTPGGNRDYKGAKESWLVGTVDGDEVVIKAGQVLVDNQAKKLYFEVVHADETGAVTSFEPELRLSVGADGSLTSSAADILGIYEDAETEEEAGFFGFFYNLDLKPMGELVCYDFPGDATVDTYVLSGIDAYGAKTQRFVGLSFQGDDFYIRGLSSLSPDEVYQGTIADGTASIPSFQIVKDADLYYFRVAALTVDEDYNSTMLRNITFQMSPDRHTLTLSPTDAYLCETSYDLSTYASTAKNVSITYYPGDTPAKPATPQINDWDKLNDALIFNVPTNDVDGNFINPDLLAYRIYADGNRYTFTTADYERFFYDTDELRFSFTDNFDVSSNGTQKIIYFHNLDAKQLQVESVYTVNGDARVSDRATYNLEETTVGSVTDARVPIATYYTSLQGMRLSAPVRGSLVLKTTVYADGSRQTVKEMAK